MQNRITPIAPTTATPQVESRPSPKSPPAHAFATLLRQTQIPAPMPAKAAPVPPAPSDGADGADASTGPQAQAARAASTQRREDAASKADDAQRVDSKDDRATPATDRDDATTDADTDTDKAKTQGKADDAATCATSGAGLPPTHGLVAHCRLPAPSAEAGAARAGPITTSIDADQADPKAGVGSSAASGTGSSDTSRSRGTIDLARRDDPASTRTAAGAAQARMPGFAEMTAILDAAKATPLASTALRIETPLPAALAPTADAAPATPADAIVATPLASPDFAQAFAVQVSVLVQDGVQHAELHLNPTDMGPVSVRIVVDGTQARIDFGADTLATRQAIEAGLPELASALRDAGMTLQGGGVSQHARDPQRDGGSGDASAGARSPWRADVARPATVVRQRTVTAGGVDLYA